MQFRSYQQPPEFPPVNYHYYNPYSQNMISPNQYWNSPQHHQTPYELFAKPELPEQWPDAPFNNIEESGGVFSNQHTNQNSMSPNTMNPNPNSNQATGPISYFQNGNGQLDFDKVLSTVGQLASTYHQVSPIVKQFSTFIKSFR